MEQPIEHIDSNQIIHGPCLKGCGNEATYLEIDHENEDHRGTCPACGTYLASIEKMEAKKII